MMCVMYHQPSSIQQWGLHGIKPNWVSIIHHATLCSMSSILSINSRIVPCRIGAHYGWCRNGPLIHNYKWCTSYSSCYAHLAKWSPHSQLQVMQIIFLMLRTPCKMIPSFTPPFDAHHIHIHPYLPLVPSSSTQYWSHVHGTAYYAQDSNGPTRGPLKYQSSRVLIFRIGRTRGSAGTVRTGMQGHRARSCEYRSWCNQHKQNTIKCVYIHPHKLT